ICVLLFPFRRGAHSWRDMLVSMLSYVAMAQYLTFSAFFLTLRANYISLTINLWVVVDPTMTYNFTEVAKNFYSDWAN
ncbi:MAG: hypothetical protein MJE68_16995, partial [Proteobacteria bacterium]|nr:hypothetical protein [Pseudomonadota bacterium]